MCGCGHSYNLHTHTLQIPSPLTAEMEAVRKDKLAERNRAKKKQKKEREKLARDARDLDRISEAQQKAEENLSEREKVQFPRIGSGVTPSLINIVALCTKCLYMIMLLLPSRTGMPTRVLHVFCCSVGVPRYFWVILQVEAKGPREF